MLDARSHSGHSHTFPPNSVEDQGGSSRYLASSPQATDMAEQIKDIISKLASEAVDKRAKELVVSQGRQ